jgi:AcrR family transcriptional regulator
MAAVRRAGTVSRMAATSDVLTADRILEATEEVLRRYGPAKATVVDVARALGVSHGSVYRHFRTKTALREAVAQRWLDRTHQGLAGIVADGDLDPAERLRTWCRALFETKRRRSVEDPELFATFGVLAEENSAIVDRHVADLTGQLAEIVRAGVSGGGFRPSLDPEATAAALLDATSRFHAPYHAREWQGPGTGERLETLLDPLVAGLRAS